MTSQPWAISQGPLHSSLCWGSFQLSKNLPWPEQTRAQGNNNSEPDDTLGPSDPLRNTFPDAEPALAAAEAQHVCRLCAGRSNAALCRNTISPVPCKSCVLMEASSCKSSGVRGILLPSPFSSQLTWTKFSSESSRFQRLQRQESHMLAKGRAGVKEHLPLHFCY